MTLSEIKQFPTTYETSNSKCHESLLRSFQIVKKVKEMLKRGDSNETILEFIDECYNP